MPPVTAEVLKVFRRRAGFTQASLAAALDVSRRTVEEWESDRPNKPPGYLRLALAALEARLPPI